MAKSSTPDSFKIAGRTFAMTGEEMTAAQENFMQGQLRAAGVLTILQEPGASLSRDGERVLTTLLLSGREALVIAGMMVEVGKRWKYEDACATAEAFAETTDRNDKLMLQNLLFGCVTGFFSSGEQSSLISPNSSNRDAEPDAPRNDDAGVSEALAGLEIGQS